MKNPSFMRSLSVILILLLLLSSVLAAFQAENLRQDNEKTQSSVDELTETLSEYKNAVSALNNCGIDYDKVSSELQSLQEEHTETASDHKTDLSQYTAEKSGYLQGADALWEAKAAMPEAWAKFTAAKNAFYEKYDAFYEGKAELEPYSWLFDNYDSISSELNSVLNAAADLSSQIQAADDWLASDENAEAAADEINSQLDSVRNSLNYLLDSVNQLPEEQKNAVNQAVSNVTGMALDDLAALLNSIDSVTPEEVRNSYANIETQLASGSDSVLAQAQDYLNQYSQLNEAWQTMLENEPMLISGKEAIDAAEQKLIDGEDTLQSNLEEIWYQLGQLDIEKSELEEEKESLEQEAERLSELSAQAEQYESLSNTVENLKDRLLADDDVYAAVESGLSIEDACTKVFNERNSLQAAIISNLKKSIIFLAISLCCGIVSAIVCFKRKPIVSIFLIFLILCGLFQALAVFYNYKITESVNIAGAVVSGFSVFEALMLLIPGKA